MIDEKVNIADSRDPYEKTIGGALLKLQENETHGRYIELIAAVIGRMSYLSLTYNALFYIVWSISFFFSSKSYIFMVPLFMLMFMSYKSLATEKGFRDKYDECRGKTSNHDYRMRPIMDNSYFGKILKSWAFTPIVILFFYRLVIFVVGCNGWCFK